MGIVTKNENNIFKNKVKSIIFKAKFVYYKNLFDRNKQNTTKTWSNIRSIMSTNARNSTPLRIIYENNEYLEPVEIAEVFNLYYCNIPQQLNENIPQSSIDPIRCVNSNCISSLLFYPVSENECISLINNLKNTKEHKDKIPVHLIKENASILSPLLCNIINKCFSTGIFPDIFKQATVIPIFKAGDSLSPSNYRPISLLSPFSKLIEKCMYNRIYSFITEFSLLTLSQFGFLKGKSTESAVTELTEYLYDVLNNKEISINIFIDFKKAFDTIDHSILFKKLELYGIQGKPLLLLKSFLTNRTQIVKIGKRF